MSKQELETLKELLVKYENMRYQHVGSVSYTVRELADEVRLVSLVASSV